MLQYERLSELHSKILQLQPAECGNISTTRNKSHLPPTHFLRRRNKA